MVIIIQNFNLKINIIYIQQEQDLLHFLQDLFTFLADWFAKEHKNDNEQEKNCRDPTDGSS